jgi:hypothetical protein
MFNSSFALMFKDGMDKLHQQKPQRPTPIQSDRPHAEKKDSLPTVRTTNGSNFGEMSEVQTVLPAHGGDETENVSGSRWQAESMDDRPQTPRSWS